VIVKFLFADEEESREAESFRRFLEREKAKTEAAAANICDRDCDDDDPAIT